VPAKTPRWAFGGGIEPPAADEARAASGNTGRVGARNSGSGRCGLEDRIAGMLAMALSVFVRRSREGAPSDRQVIGR